MKKIITAAIVALLLVSISACAFAATGLGSVTKVTSTPATADAAASVAVNTTMCAVTIEDGKIVGIAFDAVQPKSNWETAVVEPQTKLELKEGYNMKRVSGIGKEYYEQIAALEAWCIGKTVEQVLTMPVMDRGDGSHTHVPTDVDLAAGCTISVADHLKALEKAAANAK
ncbi:MAG: hypothetical protein IJ381_04515 [Clostridia bacterium]|nr:hypothetical protein [Clostridia bacterium]